MNAPFVPEIDRFQKRFALAVVTAFSVLFLILVWPFVEAVILAGVLTGILYPLFTRIATRLSNRHAAAAITVAIAFFAIVVPILFVFLAFAREAAQLADAMTPWVQEQIDQSPEEIDLPAWIPLREYLEPHRDVLMERFGALLSQGGAFLVDGASRITQGTFLFLLNLFVMLYTMFFLLLAGPGCLRFFDYTPLGQEDRLLIVDKSVSIARATIKGTFVIGVVQGALAGVAFAVAGLSGAVFWGVVMAVASIIPGIGAAIVWVPAVIYLLFTDVTWGIALLLWCALVVSSVDNLLRPRLVGGDTKMPDVLILLSTLGGIAVFGISGIVLGPLAAGLFITSWHIFAAIYRNELQDAESSPRLLDEEIEGIPEHRRRQPVQQPGPDA